MIDFFFYATISVGNSTGADGITGGNNSTLASVSAAELTELYPNHDRIVAMMDMIHSIKPSNIYTIRTAFKGIQTYAFMK